MWADYGFTSFSNTFLIKRDTSVSTANEFKYALILSAKVTAVVCIYHGGKWGNYQTHLYVWNEFSKDSLGSYLIEWYLGEIWS